MLVTQPLGSWRGGIGWGTYLKEEATSFFGSRTGSQRGREEAANKRWVSGLIAKTIRNREKKPAAFIGLHAQARIFERL